MGKGIKTRVADKSIKAIDKAAVASERMKEAYIRTRDKADHSLYAAESSPGEYASDRLSSGLSAACRVFLAACFSACFFGCSAAAFRFWIFSLTLEMFSFVVFIPL